MVKIIEGTAVDGLSPSVALKLLLGAREKQWGGIQLVGPQQGTVQQLVFRVMRAWRYGAQQVPDLLLRQEVDPLIVALHDSCTSSRMSRLLPTVTDAALEKALTRVTRELLAKGEIEVVELNRLQRQVKLVRGLHRSQRSTGRRPSPHPGQRALGS